MRLSRGSQLLAALAAAAGVTSVAPCALAHDPDNPDAHRSMPNQVTAAAIALCPTHFRGRHSDLGSAPEDSFSVSAVACAGAAITFSRELGRSFELRFRVAYDKPFAHTGDTDLGAALHELRATVSPSLVAYRLADRLTLTLGAEIGLAGAILQSVEPAAFAPEGLSSAEAWGLTVGAVAAIRPWLTYHTGLFAELSGGAAAMWSPDLELRSTTLGRVTLGWADRF